jgi:hypothetical protein
MDYKMKELGYELIQITPDADLWQNRKLEDYKVQEMAFLCCCIKLD